MESGDVTEFTADDAMIALSCCYSMEAAWADGAPEISTDIAQVISVLPWSLLRWLPYLDVSWSEMPNYSSLPRAAGQQTEFRNAHHAALCWARHSPRSFYEWLKQTSYQLVHNLPPIPPDRLRT
jgi:hypothetical protein